MPAVNPLQMMSLIFTPKVWRNQCHKPSIGVLWTLRICSIGGNCVVSSSGVYAALINGFQTTDSWQVYNDMYSPQPRLAGIDNSGLASLISDKGYGDYLENLVIDCISLTMKDYSHICFSTQSR